MTEKEVLQLLQRVLVQQIEEKVKIISWNILLIEDIDEQICQHFQQYSIDYQSLSFMDIDYKD